MQSPGSNSQDAFELVVSPAGDDASSAPAQSCNRNAEYTELLDQVPLDDGIPEGWVHLSSLWRSPGATGFVSAKPAS